MNGAERASKMKSINKKQKKQNKKARKDRAAKKKGKWDESTKQRLAMQKAARLADELEHGCDPDAKKKSKAARRRSRMLKLQSLKANSGPQNMPIPEAPKEPEPEPEIEEEKEAPPPPSDSEDDDDEYGSSGFVNKRKKNRKTRKYDRKAVPEEMRKKSLIGKNGFQRSQTLSKS